MNIFLQLGLGLIPFALAWITVMIVRKCISVKTVIVAMCSIFICATMIYASRTEDSMATQNVSMSRDEMLDLAYALLNTQNMDAVDQVVSEYSKSYGYDEECTLISARGAAMEGDVLKANALYQKLVGQNSKYEKELKKELDLVRAAYKGEMSDPVMLEQIYKMGAKPEDYGISSKADKYAKDDMMLGVKDSVSQVCKNRKINKNTTKIASLMANTFSLYDQYVLGGYFEGDIKSEAESLVSDYKTIAKKYPEAFTVYPIRMARLKACVLAEDYKTIVQSLDSYASYDELMIASELYMNKYVVKKDFNRTWRENDETAVEKVCKQLEKNLSRSKADQTTKDGVQQRIDMIKATDSGKVLDVIQAGLNCSLNDGSVTADKSKIYLQKSKIDRFSGDDKAASENMLKAIDTAVDSKDDNYSYPMCEISGIITGTGEAENVLNIANYVDQVIENSLTVKPSTDIFIERVSEEDGEVVEETNEKNEGFAEYMEEQISLCGAAVNIGMIDYSDFPNITAKVQLSSEFFDHEKDKDKLSVRDCFTDIKDFTLEKINYTESNIMLLCDNSGSMSGSVDELQSAVTQFIDSSDSSERISLVTFDSSILQTTSFTRSKDELQDVVSRMYAGGGTNIYGSILYGIKQFPYDPSANNIMIVMTDGQDGSSASIERMETEIGIEAENKGITIYTLGMGDVDANYLTQLATVGGGDFVYASDDARLTGLYDIIHGQAKNQYLLKYTAQNTLTADNRELRIELTEDKVSDTKYYSLVSEDADGENTIEINENLYIFGFDTRVMYKGDEQITVNFKGSGFKSSDKIVLTLDGVLDYTLDATFVDENTYSVVIPYGVAVDTYDLRINIGKDLAVLPDEFYVADKEQKKITFGAYIFTANKIVTNGSEYTLLSGMVTMNGWLHFKGDVKLIGDVHNAYSIVLSDNYGSYISFNEESAIGLAKNMAKKGRTFDCTPFYNLTLYNDMDHKNDMDNYRVSRYSDIVLKTLNLALIDIDILVYPDRLAVSGGYLTSMLPFQSNLIKTFQKNDFFTFDLENEVTVNKNGIYLHIAPDYTLYQASSEKTGSLANRTVRLSKAKANIDCYKDEYSIELAVKFGFEKDTSIGLTLGWKESYLDEVKLEVDRDLELNVSGVPVTLSSFSGGLKNLSNEKTAMTWERIKKSTISLGTKISVAKLSTYFKPLSKYIGDVSVISTDNFEISYDFGRGKFTAQTDILLVDEIKIAAALLEIGNLSYTNAMLGLTDVNSTGLRAVLEAGIMYDKLDGLKIKATAKGDLNAHSKFFGMVASANGELDLSWWFFEKSYKVENDIIFGIYNDHYGRTQFVVGYRNIDNSFGNKAKGRVVYIGNNGTKLEKL